VQRAADSWQHHRVKQKIENTYAINSALIGIEGFDIPEAAYVASICLLRETTLSKQNSKGWHIRSSGCHCLSFKGTPP
jgi:hypothetical protein